MNITRELIDNVIHAADVRKHGRENAEDRVRDILTDLAATQSVKVDDLSIWEDGTGAWWRFTPDAGDVGPFATEEQARDLTRWP